MEFLKFANNKGVCLFDGAMGTYLDEMGVKSPVCSAELCLSNPSAVLNVHRRYLEAGSDVITTNSFSAHGTILAEHGLMAKSREMTLRSVQIAKKAALEFGTERFVAGGLAPVPKLPTLLQIGFDELFDGYLIQIEALIEGGADLLLFETCQDVLQAKSALAAAREVFKRAGTELPFIVSVTMEENGAMLLGTGIEAALASLEPYGLAGFGVNCGLGPVAMGGHLRFLRENSPLPIICQPNAGKPRNVGGRAVYDLAPKDFAATMAEFTEKYGLSFVGGCCGTTPEHIGALKKSIQKTRTGSPITSSGMTNYLGNTIATAGMTTFPPSVSSLYRAVALDQTPRPFIVAEQTNVNGSKKFRELLLKSDYTAMADVAKRASLSSHALDISLMYAGRDEAKDLRELIGRIIVKADNALMIDSTNPESIEAALKLIGGRAIINSMNLEDGGVKALRVVELAKKYGSAVVALTIAEDGMARTVEKKFAVAKGLVEFAVRNGLRAEDVIIDPLTFSLAAGEEGFRDSARNTLAAIRKIKREIGGARTILGVSNCSFGFSGQGRKFLTSVFFHEAVEAGLDLAIINPVSIVPLDAMSKDAFDICMRLIENDNGRGRGDALAAFLKFCDEIAGKIAVVQTPKKKDDPREHLTLLVLEGSQSGLAEALHAAIKNESAHDVINSVLMPAMEEVGKRFGAGRLPLPFVLQSAEVMRNAIDILAPELKKGGQTNKGTIVLATVRGDVHDIGKDLVDAILSSNGFEVVNLGIRQTAANVMGAVERHKADAIGLSGLLVSSTEIMKEDLAIFKSNGLKLPVLVGGAALNKKFVDTELSSAYGTAVYYCKDAFEGLEVMKGLKV